MTIETNETRTDHHGRMTGELLAYQEKRGTAALADLLCGVVLVLADAAEGEGAMTDYFRLTEAAAALDHYATRLGKNR